MELASLLVSAIGLIVTFWVLSKASGAKTAAEAARKTMNQSISLTDLSQASSLIEEIKGLHQRKEWSRALDRYIQLRRLLIAARARNPDLPRHRSRAFQSTLSQLGLMETEVRKSLSSESALDLVRFNKVLINMQTALEEVRAELEQLVGSEG